jgi:hypothetical protein
MPGEEPMMHYWSLVMLGATLLLFLVLPAVLSAAL